MYSKISVPSVRRPPQLSRFDHLEVASRTGPLSLIAGKQIIVLADAQNLDLGARDLGFKVSWGALGNILDTAASRAFRHVFFSRMPNDERRSSYFAHRGWATHAKLTRTVQTMLGKQRKSNADFLLAVMSGVLVSRVKADAVVLASGDGDLVEDVAEAILMLPSARPIITLSLAGSTAQRLNCETSQLISANVELGLDCLLPTDTADGMR